jgi:nucleoside-diphosphate-sugar epimerase
MNVFVTGATGILGRDVVRQLVREGHTVHGLSRSDANDAVLRDLGAQSVRGDLDDAGFLERALTGMDAVLHLATKIPGLSAIARRSAWRESDRLRREGTRLLVDAALKTGVRVFVYPSVVFLYPDGGADWLSADATAPQPAEYLATTLDAEREVARFAASTSEARGVTLRLGGFYSAQSAQTQDMLRLARGGIAPLFGRDEAYMPTIWVPDAASAIVAALHRAPSGVYDAVDEPLTRAEHRTLLAQVVGRKALWRIPQFLAPVVLGVVADTLSRSQRVSSAKFTAATGWTPTVPSAREGWAHVASSLEPKRTSTALSLWALSSLVYLMTTGLMVGAWAQFAPRSFFDAFPGLGLAWVSVDGPFNEHLVRDVGGLNLALAVLAAIALTRPRGFAGAFGLASLAYQLPHLVYHVVHVGALPTTIEQVLQTVTLTLATLASLVLALEGRRSTAQPRGATGSDPVPIR